MSFLRAETPHEFTPRSKLQRGTAGLLSFQHELWIDISTPLSYYSASIKWILFRKERRMFEFLLMVLDLMSESADVQKPQPRPLPMPSPGK
jgi:hypothetical protein